MGEDDEELDEQYLNDFDPLAGLDSTAFDPLAGLDPAIFDPLAGLDSTAFDPLAELDSTAFDPLAGLDPAIFDPLAGLDSTAFDPLAGLDPAIFDSLAEIDPATFDPLAGLDSTAFDPLAEIETDLLEPLAGVDTGTFESSNAPQQTVTTSGESALSSEIQSFLNQAQAQLAYQRTREALAVVEKRIDDKILLFLAVSIINSLPRFLPTRQAVAAAAIGTALALYHYVLDRQD